MMVMMLLQKLITFFVAAYKRKGYVGKIIETNDADGYVSLLNHAGNLKTSTIFIEPKQSDEARIKSGGTKE